MKWLLNHYLLQVVAFFVFFCGFRLVWSIARKMRRMLFSKSFIRIFLAWLLIHMLFMCCRRCWMEVRTKLQAQLYSCFFVHLDDFKWFYYAASKQQLSACISSLRGHVASLLRHMVGSVGMLCFKIYDIFTEDAYFWKLTLSLFFFLSKLWTMHTIWGMQHRNKNSLESCTLQSFSYSKTWTQLPRKGKF